MFNSLGPTTQTTGTPCFSSGIDAQKLDQDMIGYLKDEGLPFVVALTKADKLSRPKQQKQVAALGKALGVSRDQMVVTSAETGLGIDELRRRIEEACL